MDDLKPCPACGCKHIRPQIDNGGECENCELLMFDWNKRPLEEALEAELAKYRGMEVELAAVKNDNEWLRLSWRKPLEAIEEAARKLMPGEPCHEGECSDCVDDRKLLDAIHAALAAFDQGENTNG